MKKNQIKSPAIFPDEAHRFYHLDPLNVFKRLQMRNMILPGLGGWTVGERFDDRFDTEVGGYQNSVSVKTLNHLLHQSTCLTRPPQIVDHIDNKSYSLEEAEGIEELSRVVKRLKERIADFNRRLGAD